MRRSALLEHVADLIHGTYAGQPDSDDVAQALLNDHDDPFAALAHNLHNATTDGTREQVTEQFQKLALALSDPELDFIAERAESPAGYLASRVANL
ncbi:hypothetical protein GCM10027174_44640 [Salinifilum aidingensis]